MSALGKHQDPAISAALSALASERVPAVRIVLAKALGQFGSPASIEALQTLALDDNPLVRGPAVEGLVTFNNPLITNKMRAYLTDKNSRKRRRMAVAYLSTPSLNTDPAVFAPLLKDKDAEVRLDAVQAVLQAPKGSVKAQLIYLLNDPYEDIRMSILRKLDPIMKLSNVDKHALKQNLNKLSKDPNPEVQMLVKRYQAMGY
jgi:HEAT repeat protein